MEDKSWYNRALQDEEFNQIIVRLGVIFVLCSLILIVITIYNHI